MVTEWKTKYIYMLSIRQKNIQTESKRMKKNYENGNKRKSRVPISIPDKID